MAFDDVREPPREALMSGGCRTAQAGARARKVLITGFGPFPGVDVNASSRFAHTLAHRAAGALRCDPVFHELPTSWRRMPAALSQVLAAEKPEVCVHFGVSRHTHTFEVELLAHNGTEPRLDCDGELPADDCLVAGAPPMLDAGSAAWYAALRVARGGLPVRVSEDPGRYLCNALYYSMLWQVRRQSRTLPVVFVHLPANLGKPGALPEAAALACGTALLQATLDPPALAQLSTMIV